MTNYKFQMRQLISSIHSLIHLLISISYDINYTAKQRDAIRELRKAASDCFDELYKEVIENESK